MRILCAHMIWLHLLFSEQPTSQVRIAAYPIPYSIYHSRLVSYTLIIVSFYQPSQPTSNPTDPDIVNPPSTPTPTNVSEYCFEIVIIYEALSSSTHLYIAYCAPFSSKIPTTSPSQQPTSQPTNTVCRFMFYEEDHTWFPTHKYIHTSSSYFHSEISLQVIRPLSRLVILQASLQRCLPLIQQATPPMWVNLLWSWNYQALSSSKPMFYCLLRSIFIKDPNQ